VRAIPGTRMNVPGVKASDMMSAMPMMKIINPMELISVVDSPCLEI
jgi:hypothetical protein